MTVVLAKRQLSESARMNPSHFLSKSGVHYMHEVAVDHDTLSMRVVVC